MFENSYLWSNVFRKLEIFIATTKIAYYAVTDKKFTCER